MNRGCFAKALRETWPATLLFGVGLALAEAVLEYALLRFQDQISALWSQLGILQDAFRALLGADLGGRLGPEILSSIAWVHPAVLALVWAHAIAYSTRVPAGEVDRGTIDVLLGMPVSRWQLYRTETLLWVASGIVVLLMGAAGNALGSLAAARGVRPDPWRIAIVLVNLFCLYLAVGGLAWTASALNDRRGRAIGIVFAFLLGSFLLNYLAQFWTLADRLSFLGVLRYYRPLPILRDGTWPVGDMMVLVACGAVLWMMGGIIFSRRDLCTL